MASRFEERFPVLHMVLGVVTTALAVQLVLGVALFVLALLLFALGRVL